ncbi:SpoIIE family protein phosphatase [Trichloromonas sp.]|uniref:SpoIIE family protein phosphatase n=1 Tax=Trichloromonas sp. TaxID=3069249 RepID=UPI003D819D9F
MEIRTKLLILLLLIAVIPLVINASINYAFLYKLGRHLATETRTLLTEDAHAYLKAVVENYQRLQERNRKIINIALSQQAQESIFLQEQTPTGPPKAYQLLHDYQPGLVLRQYTILDSGKSFCYPPDEHFARLSDPQRLPWYRSARDSPALTRTLSSDPITGQPALIVAAPLHLPDGSFAGITAVSRSVLGLFEDLQLPEEQERMVGQTLVVLERGEGALAKLRVVAVRKKASTSQPDQEPAAGDYLILDDPDQAVALMEKIGAGQAGTVLLMFRGQHTHWIFGSSQPDEPFPLIMVSHSQIISRATDTEQHVLFKTLQGLKISVILVIAVVLTVIVLALFIARRITRPLNQLSTVAMELAAGDYQARAEISTGDELEGLAHILNDLGPQLQERQLMAHALALAGEIQQHLLPQTTPELEGFDIFGQGTFCDETGGDYFDFIPLADHGRGSLGLAVGDVSGHGIGPALLMASARGILRSHADHYRTDLGGLFAKLNRHLNEDSEDDRFMTLFYGVLSAPNRSLVWTSAGHGPVLWYRCAHNVVEELPSTGVPLGMLAGADYPPSGPLVLEVGDLLLIGTDGIWETRAPSGNQFGIEHMKELVAPCAGQSARKIYATIVNKISEFRQGGELEDDLTLVVVKVKG